MKCNKNHDIPCANSGMVSNLLYPNEGKLRDGGDEGDSDADAAEEGGF